MFRDSGSTLPLQQPIVFRLLYEYNCRCCYALAIFSGAVSAQSILYDTTVLSLFFLSLLQSLSSLMKHARFHGKRVLS